MVATDLSIILEDLGKTLDIPNLTPDTNETCLIRLKSGLEVQIEKSRERDCLIIGSDLGEIPPGKYRENIFEKALINNTHNNPRSGLLAYSHPAEHLIIFDMLPFKGLNGILLADFLDVFSEKIKMWQEALERNEVPVVAPGSMSSTQGIFGLTP